MEGDGRYEEVRGYMRERREKKRSEPRKKGLITLGEEV